MTHFLPKLTLVLGGAACGKSAYAESLAKRSERSRVYVATAQAFDAEMKAKIAAHRNMRGPDWITIEAPIDVANALSSAQAEQVVLIDCATLWLTNVLLDNHEIEIETATFCAALAAAPCPIIVVSNEVGQGIVPDNALSRQFRNAQGKLNQMLAAQADTVVTVMAGLPLALKGDLL
ncbi:adenosylcobinamide kinase /adenosylcobinamide-phosphate guanylyltransferase [Cognatiyoonia koreensis]|uniref:Bifunctional adenosylcobalamin biosynthesis protein n=1 Tax=Cognatiyoonia koreensis TaxID=364200 RepID=A0A1I0QKW2_9RHOB|nr:bifunctional adenosylcobinamide kinase/adenosylcobinamide-phosphate guanylyltransferase [Cognatiyoonia koreensis]SEW27716.1 adenosylcobinamide kinase /adenosylcobinamide-phosphate guanylyltransferase [Cognatiyoonia koreensis]